MPNYRRHYVPGATYLFTVVSHERRPILTTALGRRCLRHAFRSVSADRPFEIVAIVLLPDHLHTIWTLPSTDANYSLRWALIKERFTRRYFTLGGTDGTVTESRRRHRERAVWQRRFWEHAVWDEDDLKRCADYIHWNPRKHGLAASVCDYPWSSFHRFVRGGEYEMHWGSGDPCPGYDEPEWGE
jgi:putative transposase